MNDEIAERENADHAIWHQKRTASAHCGWPVTDDPMIYDKLAFAPALRALVLITVRHRASD